MPNFNTTTFSEPSWHGSLRTAYYDESHERLRLEARKFWSEQVLPYADEWEEKGEVPQEVYRRCAAAGLLMPGLPKKWKDLGGTVAVAGIGDEKWDIFHQIIVTDEAHRCPQLGVVWNLLAGNGIGVPPVLNYGTEEQKHRFLPDVCSGSIKFCLGITEPGAGSDVASINTTATLSASGAYYAVSGSKKWITNGLFADYMTTAVRTSPNALSVLIVPLSSPGVSRHRIPTSGCRASGTALITLNNVRVPVGNLLGKEGDGFKLVMSNFNSERLSLSITAIRLSRVCWGEAWSWANRRTTFGKPLIERQVIRAKFAKMARGIESCQGWLEQLCWHIKVTPRAWEDARIGAQVALLKVQCGQLIEMCCREAQQIFGGAGTTREGKGKAVEQISRDLRVLVVGGGSEEILDDMSIRSILSSSNNVRSKL